jgi:hypothetical protein
MGIDERTMAMHLASPTKTNPVRKSLLSGKKAQARPSYIKLVETEPNRVQMRTIRSGATIQFMRILNPI